jgi:hypothetical protein
MIGLLGMIKLSSFFFCVIQRDRADEINQTFFSVLADAGRVNEQCFLFCFSGIIANTSCS